MTRENWLKAIKCSKEELIEWLDEMYRDDELQKQIIRKYEQYTKAGIEKRDKGTIVMVDTDFAYWRNWE